MQVLHYVYANLVFIFPIRIAFTSSYAVENMQNIALQWQYTVLVTSRLFWQLAEIVCRIVNMFIGLGVGLSAWCTAVIYTCPQMHTCKYCVAWWSDYLLDHIFPTILLNKIIDQIGFKLTGSTIAREEVCFEAEEELTAWKRHSVWMEEVLEGMV